MNKVEQYIEKQNKIILEDREKTLISLGLVDKEYSPDDFKTYKYPEIDYVNGEKKYYRNVAIQVTDEEYALILSKSKQVEEIKRKEEQEREKERNKVSYRITKNGYLSLKNQRMKVCLAMIKSKWTQAKVKQPKIFALHIMFY